MELPRISRLDGGRLDGIKSKLRFDAPADTPPDGGYADDYGYDSYADDYAYDGEYDEYAEYGDGEGTGFGAHARTSDRYAPISRPVSESRRSSSFGGVSSPNLVSASDVRRASFGTPRHASAGQRSELFDVPVSGFDDRYGNGYADETVPSSYGYDAAPETDIRGGFAPIQQPAASQSFDPYEAYAGAGAIAHAPSRSVVVLKPARYSEVERVAKSLRAGDVVVLALRETPDQLAKRILDFSFGAASMVDARVDCIADKVFAISCGAGLSDSERFELRSQGVM